MRMHLTTLALCTVTTIGACSQREASHPRDELSDASDDARDSETDSGEEPGDDDAGDAESDACDGGSVCTDAAVVTTCEPECNDDAYCTLEGTCAPRCSEDCGDPGPAFDADVHVGTLATDGTGVFYSARVEVPYEIGVNVSERLYHWNLVDSPTEIWSDTNVRTYELLYRDGYLYRSASVVDFDLFLDRYQVGVWVREGIGVRPFPVWLVDDTLWYGDEGTFYSVDTTATFSPGAVAEIGDVSSVRWNSGNSTTLFGVAGSAFAPKLVQAPIGDTSAPEVLTPFTGSLTQLVVTERALYLASHDRYAREQTELEALRRIKLDGSGDDLALAPFTAEIGAIVVAGDWVYWTEKEDALTGSIHRSHTDMLLPSEELLRGRLDASILLVVSDKLVWSDHERFFVKPLPPLACSDEVACPADQTCGAHGRCG